ncbi:hypothetical protein Ddye_028198 [Dipteronia dyeriana]|uniref:AAA+ ATPase domain-containing protein n=1 Tax=Dipteronia dyeriana TaxID=168575 RepID=A0AAD9TRF3_9ROSI|nr:hypothetical protein Ddye_028198 [Dipteronia dyeriana]
MTEIAIYVTTKISEYLVASVASPFRYLWNYKTNLEILKNEVEKLEAKRDTVERLIEVGEEPLPHVKLWQVNVKKIIDEALELIDEDNPEQINTQCCKGFSSPNLLKHYQLSKKAGKLKTDVVGLEQEAAQFIDVISCTNAPEDTWIQSNKDYKAFESRTSVLKKIIDALLNPDVNMVGIYGMGGIGKTTLAKEVARQAKQDNLFHEIVFVGVSMTPDISKIQHEIGEKLGMKFQEKTDNARARRLSQNLKNQATVSGEADNSEGKKKENKILIILDNVWERIDLETLGIPLGGDYMGLKLLLTTRNSDVLTNQMNSQCNFPINALNETEAWSLFKSMAGTCVNHPDLNSIALEVAKECGGITIAIATIARALKDKEECDWRYALQELKKPFSESFEGMTKEVYTSIKLSYDYLDTTKLKEIFLICSRMGCNYDASIRDLSRYGLGLGFFENSNTVEEALCEVKYLVKKLKENSLLIDAPNKSKESTDYGVPDDERFAMHDIVYDVARSIACGKENVCIMIDDAIPRFWANKNKLENCISITLHNIGGLPKDLRLVCSQLEFFYMKTRDSFSRIPNDFFTEMPKLQVLHLIEIDLSPLPTSISHLVNLQTLCLDKCKLGDISIIEKLEKLETLSFRGSKIEKLPEKMHRLTSIRLLDLTNCSTLKIISPNVISCFTQLEALYMYNTSIRWEIGGLNIGRKNVGLDELKRLRDHLTTLEICIPYAKMSEGLLSSHLERYKISIGFDPDWKYPPKNSRTLRFKIMTNDNADGVISQLKGIKELELFGEVRDDSTHSVSCDALFSLESLVLNDLNLEKICNGPLLTDSFRQLRTIRVDKCNKLTNIFSFSTDRVLPQLQAIEVSSCKNMEEILAIEREDDVNSTEVIHVSQLCSVTLKSLPCLQSFCRGVRTASPLQLSNNTNNGEIVSEDNIDIPKSFFNEKVVLPNLQYLKISGITNVEKIWHNLPLIMSSCVQNLTKLNVSNCHNLKELFSSSTVITEESREEDRRDTISFPKLKYLRMGNLTKLTRLWSGYYLEFPSLKEFAIHNCPELEAFIFDDKVRITQLEKMKIYQMDNLKMIWHNQLDGDSIPKLKSLQVYDCRKLLTVFPLNIRERFLTLESLDVRRCGSSEDIFDVQGIITEERNSIATTQSRELCFSNLEELTVSRCQSLKYLVAASIVENEVPARFYFPKLASLKLFKLPELRSFYQGRLTVEGPVLKKLKLCDCGIHVTDEEGQMQQPLFLVEQAFPCLEELNLAAKHVTMMWQGQVLESLFHKLKILVVYKDYSTGLPLCFIQRFQSLEKLSIVLSSYKEIFSNGEDQTKVTISARIKTLRLVHLQDLKYMWKHDFKLDVILQNLEVLNIRDCNSLINVMPHSASFQNLTVMEIESCSSLINIGTSSAAKSLVQLTQMTIWGCANIIEVVGNHGAVTEDEIILPKLKSLSLKYLPSLRSFCSWNVNLEFPSLEELIVYKCPQMKIFSQGVLIKQTLRKVKIDHKWIELRPEVDINKVIQEFHENVNIRTSIKDCEGSFSHHLE